MLRLSTPCGGQRVQWGTNENIHWCPTTEYEAAEARLAGAQFHYGYLPGFDTPDRWFDKPWLPGTHLLTIAYFYGQPNLAKHAKWVILRLVAECPYRRASMSSVPSPAREKDEDARQPSD